MAPEHCSLLWRLRDDQCCNPNPNPNLPKFPTSLTLTLERIGAVNEEPIADNGRKKNIPYLEIKF
jgi:hypothetical protein